MDPNQQEQTIRQSKSALLEAREAAIAEQKTKAAHAPPTDFRAQSSRAPLRAVLALLIAAGAGVLLARPDWLTGPSLPKESEAVQAASATLSLVEAVSHVKAFVATTGRLPARLRDAGIVNQAIAYRPITADEFEVSLKTGNRLIALKSTDSLKAIVVSAIITLQRRT